MKERPILFSTEMVAAIRADLKTQTRRVITPQPDIKFTEIVPTKGWGRNNWCARFKFQNNPDRYEVTNLYQAPQPGDQLWVKERHFITWDNENNITVLFMDGASMRFYYKDIPLTTVQKIKARKSLNKAWVPARFLPKFFSRIWLETTGVHAEQLKSISECDAKAEGHNGTLSLSWYQALWNSINGAGAWDLNPWVWVIKFKVLSTTGRPEALLHESVTLLIINPLTSNKMKKKVWNLSSVPHIKTTGLFIRITPGTGIIFLSAELSNFFPDGRINFVQDEDRPENWFIESAKKNEECFFIKKIKKGGGHQFCSTGLAKAILKSCALQLVSTRMQVSDTQELNMGFPIITKSAKQII